MKTLFTLSALAITAVSLNAQLIVATGSTAVPRMGHSSQMLTNGQVVVFGGNNGNVQSYVVYNSAEKYSNGTWTATGSMTQQRDWLTSVLLSNGNILAIGGQDASLTETATCEIYNASTGTWSATGSMATARASAQAVVLNNGKVLVVGGEFTSTCELYDQTSNTWTATGTMNNTHSGDFAMTKLADGRILVTGGNNSSTAEIYDPSTGNWTNVPNNMTVARQAHQSILMSNNKVLIAGGDFTLTSEIFDPATNTFTATGNLLRYISMCPMVNLANGKVLVYGIGNLFNPNDKEALQVYNPAAGQWYSAGIVGPSIFTASYYTVHKLQTGKFLFVDGNFTTGNGSSAYCYLVDPNSVAVGIEEGTATTNFNAYPNPAFNTLTIDAQTATDGTVFITFYDMLGNVVMEKNGPASGMQFHAELDIEALPAGTYFLTLGTNESLTTKRFVKN